MSFNAKGHRSVVVFLCALFVALILPQSALAKVATVAGDFDGDGKADVAVFRPSVGTWFVIPSLNPSVPIVRQWGTSGDIAVPGDYDGDGKTDIAVFRPSNGVWYIIPSSNPSVPIVQQWGTSGDIPVPGDYDGDGKTDIAVFRPSNGTWYIIPSLNPSVPIIRQWGTAGDIPVPGDYDGDGKTDTAVFRPSNGVWYIIPSLNPGVPIVKQWGTNGDIPVPADYDGDGKTDTAVFRPSNGVWYIIPSLNPGVPIVRQWGTNGDIPIARDYDADGKADIAVWRPATGTWFIISSLTSNVTVTQWGIATDSPVQEPVAEFTPTCVLYGQYLFAAGGTDANGDAGLAGSVTVAQNGFVVTGAIDFKDPSTLLANQAITGGSCTNAQVVSQGQEFIGGTGTLSFTAGGVQRTFDFAMRTHHDNGHLVESDATGMNAAGSIQYQSNPTSSFQGSYALGSSGVDSGGNRYIIGAEMCVNAQNGISFLLADLDDNGILSQNSGLQSPASFSAPDSNGRSTASITFSSGQTVNLAMYAGESGGVRGAFGIETTPIATSKQGFIFIMEGASGAVCFPQGAGGSYSNSTLTEVAFFAQGKQGATTGGLVGTLQNINAAGGTASLTYDENEGGTLTSASAITFHYNVAATGRATASFTDPVSNQVENLLLYLLPDGSAFFLVEDSLLTAGLAQSRGCSAPFTTCIGGGNYTFGSDIRGSQPVSEVTIDTTAQTFSAVGGSSGSYTVDSATGRGTATLNNTTTFGDTSLIFYIKGPNNIFTLQGTNAAALVGDLLK